MSAASKSSALDVRGALGGGIAQLTARSVPSAALAAEMLLLHVLGRDRAWLYAHPEDMLSAQQQADYLALLERRATGTPTQYLTGRQEFWGLEFEVTPDVLIPRPETEHIVEVALGRLGESRKEPLRIADIGTGSGCLAIALAHEFSNARVTATDISAAALEVARRNATRHSVTHCIQFAQMNLLDGYPPASFDLIVSNPPYIAQEEAAGLPREVRDHEPHAALFGGPTGVELYARLNEQAAALLTPSGILVLELGHNAAGRVCPLLENDAWREVSITRDLAGIERILSAERV
jgi:release factor glutamine methyltransferase